MFNHLRCIIFVLLFVLSANGSPVTAEVAATPFDLTVTHSDPSALEIRMKMGSLLTSTRNVGTERYDFFTIEGATSSLMEGRPELPAVVRYVLIPPQSGVELEIGKVVTTYRTDLNPAIVEPQVTSCS